jgi:hypothetical protein
MFFINPFIYAAGGDFESIATVTVGSGGAADVTFSSIAGTFQHLQICYVSRCAADANGIQIQFNGSTASNYATHRLSGDGSSATAAASTSASSSTIGIQAPSSATASVFGAGVIDILDYASTSKATTLRAITGWDSNGSGQAHLRSGLWTLTDAVTSIKLFNDVGNLAQHSTFALYGVKAP